MYVCICKAVTDKQIEAYCQQGVNTFRQLRECTGIATQCGKCGTDARSFLQKSSAISSVSLYQP